MPIKHPFNPRIDGIIALVVAGVAFLVYLFTLAPGVISLNDDTLEFQLVAVRGAIPHPSGYPLYAILLTLFTHLFPFGEMAWRANLLSALFGALAVGFTYLAARHLHPDGISRIVAVAVAGLFAFSPTFWSQATVAEVYTLHLAIMAALVWRVLVWIHRKSRPALPLDVLFLMGLGLVHHRMALLWFPAIAGIWLFLFWQNRRGADGITLPSLRQLAMGVVVFALPLALYSWLPLRSEVGSIDGTYQQVGFSCWVTACQYTSFFSENPLERERSPFFFIEQSIIELGWVVLLLALFGAWRWSRQPTISGVFLLAGFVPHLIFALLYRVPDPEVFWVPNLWMLALLAGVGLMGLGELVEQRSSTEGQPLRGGIGNIGVPALALVLVVLQAGVGWGPADRSGLTGDPTLNGASFNGQDVLNQPLPSNGVVVGLLGEITYLRYLQEAEGIAPQVQSTGGDNSNQRMAAIDAAFAVGSQPFLTRELAGLENRYSLSALGPLIEVLATPRTELPAGLFAADQPVTDSIGLAGWTRSPVANSDLDRLTVAWRVLAPVTVDLQVSARIIGEGDALACEGCQLDRPPVRNAYPTSFWRQGELVLDTYELPDPPPGSRYLLIFYLPDTGLEVGRVTITP